jgi:sulfur dioxygenase
VSVEIQELNDTNCKSYLVSCDGRAVIIDPVRERVPTYQSVLASKALVLDALLETHTHADHLMLSREQKRLLGAPIVMHKSSPSPLADRHVDHGDEIGVGSARISVLHTPGHTPDSVSYRAPGAVFTGDTLLIGGSGRTDFPGGDAGAQWDSVTGLLFTLPDDTVVYPAHDYHGRTRSTIGQEKRENPRFSGRSREQYIELMAGLGLPLPERIQQALQVNQSGFESSEVDFRGVADVARVPVIGVEELAAKLATATPPVLLDVREPEEFVGELGHVQGSLLVPLDLLQLRLPKLAGYADREVVLVCRAGARSASAAAILQSAGFSRVVNLEGGMLAWVEAKLPVAR